MKRAPGINSIQQKDPKNYFENSTTKANLLNLQKEHKKDPVIRKVMDWLENGGTDDLTYVSFELKKNLKHLMRLQIQKLILMRQFFDVMCKKSQSQVCAPKHLRTKNNLRNT